MSAAWQGSLQASACPLLPVRGGPERLDGSQRMVSRLQQVLDRLFQRSRRSPVAWSKHAVRFAQGTLRGLNGKYHTLPRRNFNGDPAPFFGQSEKNFDPERQR